MRLDSIGNKQLRSFGLTVGGAFLVIGVWPVIFRHAGPRPWALVVTALLVLPALVFPRILGPVYRGWMAVGHVLGWINTRVILAVAFYLVVTPTSVILRLMKKDPMRRGFEGGTPSYRIPRDARPGSHMKNQF